MIVHTQAYSGSLSQNLIGIVTGGHRRFMLAVLLPCLAFPFVAREPGSAVGRTGWFALTAWAIGSAIAIALPGHWYLHYFQLWLPIYAIIGGALLSVPFAGTFVTRNASRAAFLATVLVPLFLTHHWRPVVRTEPLANNRVEAERTGLAIDRGLLPNETVYVFGYLGQTSGVYFASRRNPPSGVIFDYPLQGGPSPGASRIGSCETSTGRRLT